MKYFAMILKNVATIFLLQWNIGNIFAIFCAIWVTINILIFMNFIRNDCPQNDKICNRKLFLQWWEWLLKDARVAKKVYNQPTENLSVNKNYASI